MSAQKAEQVKGIPKKYWPMIEECEADEDGYWIYLNKGWTNGDCHTIHEDSKTQAIKCLPLVHECKCKICSDPLAVL